MYFQKNKIISESENARYFQHDDLFHQVEEIKLLSKEYDVFICLGWLAAAICYLSNVNYVMYFVDVFIDPEQRRWKKMSSYRQRFFDSLFAEVLNSADAVVSCHAFHTREIQKYRKEVEEIFPFTDPELFNQNFKKNQILKEKFTFFSPQRIEKFKGQRLLWKAIKLTKSDFKVIQIDWGTGDYYEKAIKEKPDNVELISTIVHEQMPSYYASLDGLLGCISSAYVPSIEREAILCGMPVFCYSPFGFTDSDPFYKKSTKPEDISQYLDRFVQDNDFRNDLQNEQNIWINKVFDNKKLAKKWHSVLNEVKGKKPQKPKSTYITLLKIESIVKKLRIKSRR